MAGIKFSNIIRIMFFHGSHIFSSPLDFPIFEIREKDLEDYDFVEIHHPELRKNFPNKKCVLVHTMINFDPIPSFEPFGWHNFFALKIILSPRIKRTESNEKALKDFCDSIPIKKIIVPQLREWVDFSHKDTFTSKVICENSFINKQWGDLQTVRKPEDLTFGSEKENWIIFSGYECKSHGEYPVEILQKYKEYFEKIGGKFYISWHVETSSIIKSSPENSVKKSIRAFRSIESKLNL